MRDDSNESDLSEKDGKGSAIPFGLLLIAAAVIFFGVLTANLPAVAIGLLVAIVALYRLPDSAPVPAVPVYALLALGALILAGIAGLLSHRDVASPFIPLLWVTSMVLALLAAAEVDRALPQTTTTGPPAGGSTFNSFLWIIPIILIAFALRIHDLETYPPLHGDEGEMGLAALRVLSGDAPPPTATGWLDHPALFHYLQAAPVALFGRTGFALRLLSVMAGVLCVPLIYQIGRRGWGPVVGLTAAWLLTFAHQHVHFSRIGLNNIESTFFLLLFLFLTSRTRPRRITLYALAGLAVGLAQYMYFGSRVILIIAPLLLFVAWRKKIADTRQLVAFGAALFIAVLPLAVFYINNPDPFINRSRGVFALSENNIKHVLQSDQASLPGDVWPALVEQARRNLSFFISDGDRSPFYANSVPGLDIVTAVLFWLGLGLALTRLPRFQEFAVLVWLALGVFIGGVLTIDAPNSPRLLIVIPAAVLLAALFVDRTVQLLSSYPRSVKMLFLIIVFGLTALLNTKIYFYDYKEDLPIGNQSVDTIAREMRAAGESTQVFLVGQPQLYAHYGTIHFLAGDEVQDLASPEEIPAQPGQELLFVVLPINDQALESIKQRLPGGESFPRLNHRDELLYTIYTVRAP